MTTRLINRLDEPITLEPGEAIDLGFKGDYETSEYREGGMSSALVVIEIVGEVADGI